MQGWETAAHEQGGTMAAFHNLLLSIIKVTTSTQQEFRKN